MELAGTAGGRARIGVLDDDRLTYWETPDPGETASPVSLSRGSSSAPTTALGQLLLAHADEDTSDRVLSRELGASGTAGHLTHREVQAALSVTRLSGVAITRTFAAGGPLGVAVAVPVHGVHGQVVAGIEVDVLDFDRAESVLVDLKAAAGRVGAGCVGSR